MEKGIVSADSTLIKGLEAALEWGGTEREISFLVVSAIALVVSFFAPDSLPFNPAWIAVVLCGAPIIIEAFIGLTTEFDIKADVLVSLALVASLIIGEYFAAGEVAVIMQLGALLEDLTVAKARSGIEKLVDLTPRTARRVTAVGEETIPADDVRENDVLRVLPGETVPADGIITAGQTSIDESVMTGESLPVDKASGDEVRSGTVNQFGAFEMRATRAGADSANQAAQRHVDEGCTVVLVAIEGTCAGFVALADTVRPTAQAAIRSIKEISFDPVLLTGDHAQAAKHIAKTAGIEEVHSDCLPEDKLLAIEDYEMSGQPVCMVGDGVNDAPALKRATVGITMGQTGSDIAVDAADIALVRDDIASLPHLLALSKRMLTTIRLNLTFSMTLNFVAIVLAMTGIMGPVVGALVHNAGSVVVIINSALLLSWKRRGQTNNAGAHGSTDQAL